MGPGSIGLGGADHLAKFSQAQAEAYSKYEPGYHQIMSGRKDSPTKSHGKRSNSQQSEDEMKPHRVNFDPKNRNHSLNSDNFAYQHKWGNPNDPSSFI